MSLVVTQYSHVSPEANEIYAAVLGLAAGDKLQIRDSVDGTPRERTWAVVKRVKGGWLLEADGTFERFTDVRIRDLRCDGAMLPVHRNPTGISVDKLRRVLAPRDVKSARLRLELDRKLAYCRCVDDLRSGREPREKAEAVSAVGGIASADLDALQGSDGTFSVVVPGPGLVPAMTLSEAAALSAERTFAANRARWRARLKEILVFELSKPGAVAEIADDDERLDRPDVARQPTARMVEDWWKLQNASDLPDLILTPDWSRRGNRRPRKTGLLEGRTVYAIMDEFGDRYHACPEKVSVRQIYRLIEESYPGFKKIVQSHASLQRHFDRRYEDRYELMVKRDGAAKAHAEFGVHLRTRRPPVPLMEVEIDHCVADVIVVDEISGTELGRPYITAMIDRCTRMILGIHLSFEPPSWASVARCLTHAFNPKDLRPYRRATNPDDEFALDNDWPCEGIPEVIVTDRGKEFVSTSMEASAAALGFGHLPLTGRSPWLKGTIERFFGTMHVQVYSDVHGKTFSNSVEKGDYDSVGRAELTLEKLRRRLLKWIVDDYHMTFQNGLADYPLHVWRKRSEQLRINPAPSLGILQQVLGTHTMCPIGDRGITLDTHCYWHESMQGLRNTNRPGTKYHVRFDPFDIGSIWFVSADGGVYVRAWSDAPEDTDGVSRHVSRVRRRALRRYGDKMTPEDDRRIVAELDRTAADLMAGAGSGKTIAKVARYFLPNGAFFTAVADWDGVPPGFARRDAFGRPVAGAADGSVASELVDDRSVYVAIEHVDRVVAGDANADPAAPTSVESAEDRQRRLVEQARLELEMEEEEEL